MLFSNLGPIHVALYWVAVPIYYFLPQLNTFQEFNLSAIPQCSDALHSLCAVSACKGGSEVQFACMKRLTNEQNFGSGQLAETS